MTRALVLVALLVAACGATHPSPESPAPPPAADAIDAGVDAAVATTPRIESAHAIPDDATWRSLAARPDGADAELDLPSGLHQASLRLRKGTP